MRAPGREAPDAKLVRYLSSGASRLSTEALRAVPSGEAGVPVHEAAVSDQPTHRAEPTSELELRRRRL